VNTNPAILIQGTHGGDDPEKATLPARRPWRSERGRLMTHDVIALLGDTTLTWTERRTRLKGWRGPEASQADAAVGAQRLAPALCAVGATAGALTGSPLVLAAFAATALAGALAANHPFESLYNRWATSRGRQQLPANRAANRSGCVIGAAFLGGAAIAFALGATTLGLVLALVLGGTAAFVAVTGICVPSLIFTTIWGTDRATAPTLAAAARTGRDRTDAERHTQPDEAR